MASSREYANELQGSLRSQNFSKKFFNADVQLWTQRRNRRLATSISCSVAFINEDFGYCFYVTVYMPTLLRNILNI
jgi:hypothetical protein